MTATRVRQRQRAAARWVHVFEEDTAEGAVYRRIDDDIPLSRRPREQLVLEPDGAARFYVPGPDDRLVEHPATWHGKDDPVPRARSAGTELRILDRSPSRLVVEVRHRPPKSD
jgi:hypothetical protein